VNLIWFDHFFFLLVGVILPLVSLYSAQATKDLKNEDLFDENESKKDIYYTNGFMLLIGGLLVTCNYALTGKSFTELGFVVLTCALALIYIIDTIFSIQEYKKDTIKEQKDLEIILPKNWSEYKHYTFLAINAGISEEIVYRGFLVNYLREVLPVGPSNILLAVFIPSVIFALSHMYQGWLNVLKIFTISILLGNIYVYSESLLIVVIIHVVVDLISGSMLIFFNKKEVNENRN
jgi:membrane protease YdiL (CAAX protease family)